MKSPTPGLCLGQQWRIIVNDRKIEHASQNQFNFGRIDRINVWVAQLPFSFQFVILNEITICYFILDEIR